MLDSPPFFSSSVSVMNADFRHATSVVFLGLAHGGFLGAAYTAFVLTENHLLKTWKPPLGRSAAATIMKEAAVSGKHLAGLVGKFPGECVEWI